MDPPRFCSRCHGPPFRIFGFPGYFSLITYAIQAAHRSVGTSFYSFSGKTPYDAEVYADDAIVAGPRLGSRRSAQIARWDRASVGLAGVSTLNMTKVVEEEGLGPGEIAIGLRINTESYTTSMPEAEIEGGPYVRRRRHMRARINARTSVRYSNFAPIASAFPCRFLLLEGHRAGPGFSSNS